MIVAIARELGAGGREVGERIAASMGAELLDDQIVDLVAQKIGAPASYVAAKDEAVESFAERLFRTITQAQPEAYAAKEVPDWSEDRLFSLTSDLIREHARDRSIVVIGRGAPILLKEFRGVLRLFVIAPLDARIARLSERLGCSRDEAHRQIKASDQRRAAYFKQYFGVDWRDPHLYDLVVNTETLGVEQAARIAVECRMIRGRTSSRDD